ncbi:MAG: hypothetical protein F6K44_01065 [Moorea sp. SIO3E2]|nr:hypothetical protein [Moorena sp. SIO3E2]
MKTEEILHKIDQRFSFRIIIQSDLYDGLESIRCLVMSLESNEEPEPNPLLLRSNKVILWFGQANSLINSYKRMLEDDKADNISQYLILVWSQKYRHYMDKSFEWESLSQGKPQRDR